MHCEHENVGKAIIFLLHLILKPHSNNLQKEEAALGMLEINGSIYLAAIELHKVFTCLS